MGFAPLNPSYGLNPGYWLKITPLDTCSRCH